MKELDTQWEPLQGVSQAIELFMNVASSSRALSPGELSQRLRLNRTTVYRIIETLVKYDFLGWTSDRNVTVGGAMWKIIRNTQEHHPIIERATSIMYELWGQTMESVSLSLRFGNSVIRIVGMESPQLLRVTLRLGDEWPLHVSARGRVVLAHLTESEFENYIQRPLSRFTANTITEPQELRESCARIRKQGYAISQGEFIENAGAIAVPLFFKGRAIGALDVAGPVPRVFENATPDLLMEAGAKISVAADFRGGQ